MNQKPKPFKPKGLSEENAKRIEMAKTLGWTFREETSGEGRYVAFEHPEHGMMRYFPDGSPEDTRDRLDLGEIPQLPQRAASSVAATERDLGNLSIQKALKELVFKQADGFYRLNGPGHFSWVEVHEYFKKCADELMVFGIPRAELAATVQGQTELLVSWACRVHPTNWWHEVGCPHCDWTKEQLLEALVTAKQSHAMLLKQTYGIPSVELDGQPESASGKPMFKTPVSEEWIRTHANEDEPEFIGPVSAPEGIPEATKENKL